VRKITIVQSCLIEYRQDTYASKVGKQFEHFDAVYASTYGLAGDTARQICAGRNTVVGIPELVVESARYQTIKDAITRLKNTTLVEAMIVSYTATVELLNYGSSGWLAIKRRLVEMIDPGHALIVVDPGTQSVIGLSAIVNGGMIRPHANKLTDLLYSSFGTCEGYTLELDLNFRVIDLTIVRR
jgi:hypothetical protein